MFVCTVIVSPLKVGLNVYVTWSKKACKREFCMNWIVLMILVGSFWGSAIKMLGCMHTLQALIYILFFFKYKEKWSQIPAFEQNSISELSNDMYLDCFILSSFYRSRARIIIRERHSTKPSNLRHWNFNGSTILSTFYALPYIGIKHSLHKLYKCMLQCLDLYIRGINLLFMWCVEILWLLLIAIHVVRFLNRVPVEVQSQ